MPEHPACFQYISVLRKVELHYDFCTQELLHTHDQLMSLWTCAFLVWHEVPEHDGIEVNVLKEHRRKVSAVRPERILKLPVVTAVLYADASFGASRAGIYHALRVAVSPDKLPWGLSGIGL